MNFGWSNEQIALRATAHDLGQLLSAGTFQRDASNEFSRDEWHRAGVGGIQGVALPEAFGGQGHDVVTAVGIMEAFGKGCRDNGLTLALNGHIWCVQQPILEFGSEEQKQRFLPKLCSGEWAGADGLTERDAGSDILSMATTAVKVDGGYVLNGRKSYIGLGPVADLALVYAMTDREAGAWGMSVFLLERGMDGFTQEPNRPKMGLRTNPLGDLVFNDCFIPEENRLGEEGAGLGVFTNTNEWERAFIFASHVGRMEAQLEATIAYATTRRQFDQPIGKFQAVSHRIAEMRLRLETCRLLIYKLAWLKQNGLPAGQESAMAKLHISEAFLVSSLDAMRISGATGYLAEFEIERDLRDSLGGVIYGGTSDIQRNAIARYCGL
ncbi:MAG: acyl-CoA dehydrogenase family protein [Verrucomicrobiales bacterium]